MSKHYSVDVSEIKLTRVGHFQSGKYKCSILEKTNSGKKQSKTKNKKTKTVYLKLRQDIAQTIRDTMQSRTK